MVAHLLTLVFRLVSKVNRFANMGSRFTPDMSKFHRNRDKDQKKWLDELGIMVYANEKLGSYRMAVLDEGSGKFLRLRSAIPNLVNIERMDWDEAVKLAELILDCDK
jgi:hypothetical protein